MRINDHTATAYQIRMDRAVNNAGGKDRIFAEAVQKLVESFRDATNGETPTGAALVVKMRELGGFTNLLLRSLGPEPVNQPNRLGFETNEAVYVRQFIRNNSNDIVDAAKKILFD